MYISIVLAQMLGISFALLGLSMLFNQKWTNVVVEEITKNQAVIWFAGLITLLLGSTIVVLNNDWTSGLPLLVTVLGWLILIKGAVIVLFPDFTISYYRKMNKGNIFMWGGLIVFVLSLVLLFYR